MEGFKGMVGSLVTRAADGCNIRIEMTIPTARFDPVLGEMETKMKQFEGQAGCKVEITYEITGHVHVTVHTEKVVLIKRFLSDLINSYEDDDITSRQSPPPSPDRVTTIQEILLPRSSVDVVMGKRGEIIKGIEVETSTKIQVKRDRNPASTHRCLVIVGSCQQVDRAIELITELVVNSYSGVALTRSNKVGANTPRTPMPPLSVGVSRNDSNFNWQDSTNFWNPHAQRSDAGAIMWTNHARQYCADYSTNSQNSYANLQSSSNFHTNLPAYSPQMAENYRSVGHHEHATLIQAQMGQNAALGRTAASVFPSHASITSQRTFSEAYAPTSPGSPDPLRYSPFSHLQTRDFPKQDNFSHSNYNG